VFPCRPCLDDVSLVKSSRRCLRPCWIRGYRSQGLDVWPGFERNEEGRRGLGWDVKEEATAVEEAGSRAEAQAQAQAQAEGEA